MQTIYTSQPDTSNRTEIKRPLKPRGFSLNDTKSISLRLRLNAATILIALGTTGTLIVDGIIKRICQQTGSLPKSLDYLTVDGAAATGLCDSTRHRTLGVNGCGTDPNEGRKAFQEAYPDLRRTVDTMLLGLQSNARQMPAAVGPQQCVEAFVIGGNGGSSGGMAQEAVTLLNDLLIKRRVKVPRVHGVFLGADMPMQDATRNVTQSQIETVSQTAAGNLRRYISDHMNPCPLPQCNGAFTIKPGQRLWSLSVMDQSNGLNVMGRTEDLIEMVSLAYFAAICTHCSTSVEDRVKDLEVLGDTARALSVSYALT